MGDFGKLHMHPFAALFPLLDDAALTALADDIKQNGQLEPITLDAEGTTLIDGRNRYRACEMVKVDPVYQRLGKHFAEVDLIRYIISKNLNRRHLDVGQRAMIGLEAAEALEREAKQRQREGGGDRKSATAKSVPPKSGGANRSGEVAHQVAALMKIGHSAVSQAKKVKDTSPRLAQDVRAGTLSLNDAYKQVRRSPGEAPTPQTSTIMVTLPTHTGESVQYKQPKSPATFNRTNDQVSWAAWTWNPVTGCLH